MSRIKLHLIVVVIWFAFIFKMDTSVLGQQLNAYVYFLSLLIACGLLIFPAVRSVTSITSSLLVFALHAAFYFISGTANEFGTFQMFIVEEVVLQITLLLMRWVSHPLTEFDKAAETFMLGVNGIQLLPSLEGETKINDELYRARRFDRPVAVVYCSLPMIEESNMATLQTDFISFHMTKTFKRRYQQAQLARAVGSLTYKSDIMMEHENGVIVALPESGRAEVSVFVNQLGHLLKETVSMNPIIGTAIFPDDGLVCEDLIKVAVSTAKVWHEDDYQNHLGERKGDFLVDLEQRVKIEKQAEWLNRLPHSLMGEKQTYQFIKRAIDIGVVLVLLPLTFPTMVLIALLIYLDDGAPVFYMQPRTGYGGRRFMMYKFRTMYVNAKSIEPQVAISPDGTMRYIWPEKNDRDPRITRIGRFLRKTSLDEFPQFLNVLKGDMTLVGPRPTTWNIDKYTRLQTARLTARPGITGLWQVSARDATNPDERLIWDMKYIEKASLWLDMVIVWQTLTQVFKKSGV